MIFFSALKSVAQPSFISINCTYFNTILQHFIWEYFSFDIYWLIFPQPSFRPHPLSVAIKLFFFIPHIAVSCMSSPIKCTHSLHHQKAAWRCSSPPSCCTSTSCFIGWSTSWGRGFIHGQLPAMKIHFSRRFFPPLLSLACTHPFRTPWMYALFIRSLPCTLKCFRSADCLSSISVVRPLKSWKKKKKALQTNWREVRLRMRQADKCSSGSHYTAGFVTTHKDWLGKQNFWIIRSV